jgi:hypothetical protein
VSVRMSVCMSVCCVHNGAALFTTFLQRVHAAGKDAVLRRLPFVTEVSAPLARSESVSKHLSRSLSLSLSFSLSLSLSLGTCGGFRMIISRSNL